MTSIRAKITRTYILVSLALTVLLLLPLGYFVEQYFYDRLISELKTHTGVLGLLIREHSGGQRPAKDLFSSLHTFAGTTRVRITLIDSAGTVLFESSHPESLWTRMENHLERPENIAALERGIGWNTRYSTTLRTSMLYVSRAVDPASPSTEELPGLRFIRVGLESTEVDRQVNEIRLMIFGAGFVAFACTLLVIRVLSRRITGPLLEIAGIVQDIKAGDLERKLPVRSNDEIGRLAELINEMTAKLKDDIVQLRKLERFRSEFLGNVSHELRTPIFSLKGFLETLSEGAIEDPTVNRKFVEKAYHHASRLDNLLTDLIEISRIESGDMKMSFRYFDVVAFLHQVRADFVDAAEQKQQSILVESSGREIVAFGDKDRLRHAMESLVDNAVKYSPPGARIELKAEDGASVIVSVSDNGPGIAAEHLPRIFERFYRVDKNRSREVGGTGLGLAIAKHILEAHGTKIRVESTVGKGSRFFFDLKK